MTKKSLEKNQGVKIDWVTQNANWLYPTLFSPLVWGFMRAYTRPSSLYIRKVAVVISALAAFQIGVRHQVKEYNLFLLRNYHKFDQCFKDALETGDSRYLSDFIDLKFEEETQDEITACMEECETDALIEAEEVAHEHDGEQDGE